MAITMDEVGNSSQNIDVEADINQENAVSSEEIIGDNDGESLKARTFKKYFRMLILGIDCTYWSKNGMKYKIRPLKFSLCYFYWMIFMTLGYIITFNKYDGIHEAKILPRILTPNMKISLMVFVAGIVPTIQPYYSLKYINKNLPHIFKHMDRLPIPGKFQKTFWQQFKEVVVTLFWYIFTCDYTLVPRLIGTVALLSWIGFLGYGFFMFSWHGFDPDGFYFIIFILFYSSPSVTVLMFTRALIDWLSEIYIEFIEDIRNICLTNNCDELQSVLYKYPIEDLQGIFKHICKAKAKQTLTVDMFILTYSAFFCTLQIVESFDNFPYVVPLLFIFVVLAVFCSAPAKLDKKHHELVSVISNNIIDLKKKAVNVVNNNSNKLEENSEDQDPYQNENYRKILEIMKEHLLLNKPELQLIWSAKIGNGFVPFLLLTLLGYSRLVIYLAGDTSYITTASPFANITTAVMDFF